ncbi:unnamed protein product [Mesocestoides corti]|uniref:Transmembrane protein n=1 Tax=Mesocestoides corti TaxID=53468 RepID=A0A0R3U1F5_MESCO|nr:unnamed protein product [Mesocestoides corti]
MCYIDFYEKTNIHIHMTILGALLTLLSIFMITLGIARCREDVWVAGILVAIVGVPIFIFGLFIFCTLNRPGRIPGCEQDFSVSKLSMPTIANVHYGSRFFYPIKGAGYDYMSRVSRQPQSTTSAGRPLEQSYYRISSQI